MSPDARFVRSAQSDAAELPARTFCLSAMVHAVVEPDIHSLYRASMVVFLNQHFVIR